MRSYGYCGSKKELWYSSWGAQGKSPIWQTTRPSGPSRYRSLAGEKSCRQNHRVAISTREFTPGLPQRRPLLWGRLKVKRPLEVMLRLLLVVLNPAARFLLPMRVQLL
ncbi:unnamed protein product [Amoebophrya sp. A120]|nr:unnamed protein product [Amoebophrya sp. A120]|eukprot:GSA120T00011407001.1